MKTNTEADVRTDTVKVMAIFFVAIIFLALTTDPIKVEPKRATEPPCWKVKPTTAVHGTNLTWTVT